MSYYYNPLYWQTACLTVNSGSQEVDENTKQKSTNYGKIAEAIGKLKTKGVKVAQPLINSAEFGFVPDINNEQIIFSFKGIVGIGDDIAHTILENRPYSSFNDFCERMYDTKLVKKSHVIKLIKAGAFNEFGKPRKVMLDFLSKEAGVKDTLNMQNMKSIIDMGLLKGELTIYEELFNFKSYVSKRILRTEEEQKGKRTIKTNILGLDNIATDFYVSNFNGQSIVGHSGANIELDEKKFTKEYNEAMKPFKELMVSSDFVEEYNKALVRKEWAKYASGTVSKWEMDSISYYESEHELAKVDKERYNIVNFFELDPEPVVMGYNEFKGKRFPKQKVFSVVGTVLDRDKTKKNITVLTPDGVITVKTHGGSFNHYDKQISRRVGDKKEVVEKSWFTRGNLLLLNGYRRDDNFVLKTYRVKGEPVNHTINLIKSVDRNTGELVLQDERARE